MKVQRARRTPSFNFENNVDGSTSKFLVGSKNFGIQLRIQNSLFWLPITGFLGVQHTQSVTEKHGKDDCFIFRTFFTGVSSKISSNVSVVIRCLVLILRCLIVGGFETQTSVKTLAAIKLGRGLETIPLRFNFHTQ